MSERAKSPATWVLSNHDMPRHATRFALPQVPTRNYHQFANDWILRNGESYQEDRPLGTKRVKAALLMEMALPGSAYVYQGEELGLFEVADIPWNRLEDPVAFNTSGSGFAKGRDGCRVPPPGIRRIRTALSAFPLAALRIAKRSSLTCPSPPGSRISASTKRRATLRPCWPSTDRPWLCAIVCSAPTSPWNGWISTAAITCPMGPTALPEESSPTSGRTGGLASPISGHSPSTCRLARSFCLLALWIPTAVSLKIRPPG